MRCPLCAGEQVSDVGGAPALLYCDPCRTAFQWPQPSAEELSRYYDGTLDTTYLFKYSAIARARAQLHAGLMPRLSPASIFDIGCGTGDYLAAFRELGWSCSGLEISHQLAEVAREHHGLDVIVADFMEHPFAQRFDAVSAQHVLEHMNDPAAFLEKARTLVVDGGFALLAVPNYDSLLNSWAGSNWLFRAEPTHLFHFTPEGVRNLARSTGFEVAACTTWQFDAADLVWALKKRFRPGATAERAGRGPAAEPRAHGISPEDSRPQTTARLPRRAVVATAGLFRPWVGRSGRGSEVIAVLRRR